MDVNDNTPQLLDQYLNLTIANTEDGYIYNLEADDPDSNENGDVTFEIIDPPNHTYFTLTPAGALSANSDVNVNETFYLQIRVTDNGTTPLSSVSSCTYVVYDVNDQPPIITWPGNREVLVLQNTSGPAFLTDFLDQPVILNATDADVIFEYSQVEFMMDVSAASYQNTSDYFDVFANGSVWLKQDLDSWQLDINDPRIVIETIAYDNPSDPFNRLETPYTLILKVTRNFPPIFNVTVSPVTCPGNVTWFTLSLCNAILFLPFQKTMPLGHFRHLRPMTRTSRTTTSATMRACVTFSTTKTSLSRSASPF